jgi:hypothetical protein
MCTTRYITHAAALVSLLGAENLLRRSTAREGDELAGAVPTTWRPLACEGAVLHPRDAPGAPHVVRGRARWDGPAV